MDNHFTVKGDGKAVINGDGTATLSGINSRNYITIDHMNVEITGYFKLISTGLGYSTISGPLIEARTDAGHTSSYPNPITCKGIAYGGLMRDDDNLMFKKELGHPAVTQNNPSVSFPHDERQWIGYKYVLKNITSGNVQLELWTDKTDGVNGGDWKKQLSYIDDGGWSVSTYTYCSQPTDFIINYNPNTNGTTMPIVILRNQGETFMVKNFSIREIAVN